MDEKLKNEFKILKNQKFSNETSRESLNKLSEKIIETTYDGGNLAFQVNDSLSRTNSYERSFGLDSIVKSLVSIYEDQKELIRIDKMNKSKAYSDFVSLGDKIKKYFGVKVGSHYIIDLFDDLQKNVKIVNNAVMSMSKNYQSHLDNIEESLEEIYGTSGNFIFDRNITLETSKKINDELSTLGESLDSLNQFDDPKGYADLKINNLKLSRKRNDARSSLNSLNYAITGYKDREHILENQYEIFSLLLNTINEFGVRIEVYQRALEDLAVNYVPTENLAKAVVNLSYGLNILDGTRQGLLENYYSNVSSIMGAASNSPAFLGSLNEDSGLSDLSKSIKSGSFDRAISLEKEVKRLYDQSSDSLPSSIINSYK